MIRSQNILHLICFQTFTSHFCKIVSFCENNIFSEIKNALKCATLPLV